MAFDFREFIRNGFFKAVDGGMPDYKIMLNAAGYATKGVLTNADLTEIKEALDRRQGEKDNQES